MALVHAQLKNLRMAPRKVRLTVGLIRRSSVATALDQLAHLSKRSAHPLIKLIASAVANAHYNFKFDQAHLWIKSIHVDEGVKLKRFRAKGFSRSSPIQKKTSCIRLVLEHRPPKNKSA